MRPTLEEIKGMDLNGFNIIPVYKEIYSDIKTPIQVLKNLKAKSKKVARLGKNPAQAQQNKTMNMVSYVMLAVIIFMGFSLPAAMGVYWFIGALVSLAQSLITQAIMSATAKNKKHKK